MAMAASASAYASASFPARRPGASSARLCGAGAGVSVRTAEGGKWWVPLVGSSGKTDYVESPAPAVAVAVQGGDAVARRLSVGGLMEEKAWELRVRMTQTEY